MQQEVGQEAEQDGVLMGRRVGFFLLEDLQHLGPKVLLVLVLLGLLEPSCTQHLCLPLQIRRLLSTGLDV